MICNSLFGIILFAATGATDPRGIQWQPMGDFKTVAACRQAARTLGFDARSFRCVSRE